MPQPTPKQPQPGNQAVGKQSFLLLANVLQGRDRYKKDPHSDAVRQAGQAYEERDFVAAYEIFRPVYEKVAGDMQRVLARNPESEANKLSHEQRKPLAAAKDIVQRMRGHAQQVLDQCERLRKDLESKAQVRAHIRMGRKVPDARASAVDEAPPTTLNSASDTRLETPPATVGHMTVAGQPYRQSTYAAPEIGSLYSVRDKSKGERVIRVIGKSPDGQFVQVDVFKDGQPQQAPIQLAVESLARQAEKGWCQRLVPVEEEPAPVASDSAPVAASNRPDIAAGGTLRLDIQNFSRCCGDIARANIKFDTQLIKDIGDGPFRAGKYEQAFLNFEQCAVAFNTAVGNSRRAIADGRRQLTAEKGNLSGKEIQERTVAFLRSEQLIHTAEREFSTILEGLRMYLRAQQGEQAQ
jgi:hypothetical protein